MKLYCQGDIWKDTKGQKNYKNLFLKIQAINNCHFSKNPFLRLQPPTSNSNKNVCN